MKVAVFGASVSAQRQNHKTGEVTGYAEVFRRSHQASLGLQDIRQITYAGNRLSDGGLACLPDILTYAPDICVFEPLIEDARRGAPTTEAEFRMIYRRLLAAGILPVTLMLPNPRFRVASQAHYYPMLVRICRDYGLPVIDAGIPPQMDLSAGFNGVHTRAPGAAFYAQMLRDGLQPLLNAAHRLALVAQALPKAKAAPRQSFMRRLGCRSGMPEKTCGLLLDLTLAPPPRDGQTMARVRLVQPHLIGAFSPVITTRAIDLTNSRPANAVTVSVWDDYCHYTRASFMTSGDLRLPPDRSYQITLGVTDKDPDYASCRRPVANWPMPSARHLQPQGPLFVMSDTPFTARVVRYDSA